MLLYSRGSEDDILESEDLKNGLFEALKKLGQKTRVLALPPDFTRLHSRAGELTRYAWEFYGGKLTDILPAIGTHFPMTSHEMTEMFGEIPQSLFREHNWRSDLVKLGEVPGEYLYEVSEGMINYSWPAQVNSIIGKGNYDLILSLGQVVPHEVIGMANYNKNVFIGAGGSEGINKSHFLGAVYGMERIMGRADNPVRRVLNYASEHFATHLPLIYVQTVVGRGVDGKLKTRGMYIGDDIECFNRAAELSLKVNFQMLDDELHKVVVYLDPSEFKSTWLGNKSIYRTRMAIADGGELIVLAPGLREFGEDREIDKLIRKYGYLTTPEILDNVKKTEDLKNNLSAAAHLIHGSSENRFTITYCPGHLTREEIEGVNFNFTALDQMRKKYNPEKLKDGFNNVEGENIYYISNPAIGLWSHKRRFKN